MRLGWLLLVAACHSTWGEPPPPPVSCADAAEHVLQLVGTKDSRRRPTKVRDAFARRCLADGWSQDVRSCIVATVSLSAPRHCKALMTPAQRGLLEHDLGVIARTPAYSWAPPVCAEYRALVGTLGGCAGIPRQAQDALQDTYRQLILSWDKGDLDTPRLEAQCRAMTDALHKAMVTTCGM